MRRIAVGIALLLLPSVALGQVRAAGHVSKHPISLEGARMSVTLPAGLPWTVALKDTTAQPFAVVVYTPASNHYAVVDWPAGKLQLGAGTVELLPVSGAARAFVYAQVPRGTKLVVTAGAATAFSGAEAGSLFVTNGVVDARPFSGFGDALLRYNFPTPQEPPDYSVESNGQILVGLRVVRTHIQSLSLPSGVPDPSHCGCTRQAVFLVSIDGSGSVTAVTPVGGDPAVLSVGKESIPVWTFRPFRYKGQVVSVRAFIPLLVGPQGHTRLPELP